MSKLAKYPAVYSRILLSVPLDGSPLDIPLADEVAAQRERLQFYNFLKFVRRNARECAHLHTNNRANLVSISLQGSVLRFAIRGGRSLSSLEQGFNQVATTLKLPDEAVQLHVVPDDSLNIADDLIIPGLDNAEAPNPLDLLQNFQEHKDAKDI